MVSVYYSVSMVAALLMTQIGAYRSYGNPSRQKHARILGRAREIENPAGYVCDEEIGGQKTKNSRRRGIIGKPRRVFSGVSVAVNSLPRLLLTIVTSGNR